MEVKKLAVGTRVRHYGHQWPDAYRKGTGVIIEVKPGARGTWEYLIRHDETQPWGDESWWNSDMTMELRQI